MVFVLLVLAGCAGAPKTAEAPLDGSLPLDQGALLYLVADVAQARPLLDLIGIQGLRPADAAQVLDRTRYAAAALFPPDSGRRIQAAAWGNYPRFGAGFAFASDRSWKKRRAPGGKSYWYSAARGFSLALSSAQAAAAVAAPGAPPPIPHVQGPGIELPQGFTAFREGACLALWMENPAESLDRFLEGLHLPIRIPAEQLMAGLALISAEPGGAAPQAAGPQTAQAAGPGGAGSLYEIRLRIKTPSEANARTLITLFSTARLFITRSGNQGMDQQTFALLSFLFARRPEQEGAYFMLRSAPMGEGEIALLFSLFSL
ncbi:MAG: hypothetical protein LBQ46_04235 [Treponema sp.]|jgi:hypothetical protein|nr:hypothetical protein [Treponema sp.]